MGFSSGTYTFTTSGLPVVTGTTISSTVENAKNTDIASALSTCLLKDGTQTVTANIPMATFILTGLGAGTANGHSIRYEQAPAGIMTAKGDVIGASAANTPVRVAVGANTTILMASSGDTAGFGWKTFESLTTTTAVDQTADYLPFFDATTNTINTKITPANFITGMAATAAEQETATSNAVVVTPLIQQRHPSAAKGWDRTNFTGTAVSSYNVTSETDSGAGNVAVNWGTDFSGTNYATFGTVMHAAAGTAATTWVSQVDATVAAGSATVLALRMSDFTAQDASSMNIIAFGDQ